MTTVATGATLFAETNLIARDWQTAVRIVGGPLVERQAITENYLNRCITMVEEAGPYIVIAPGMALAHARPADGALRLALSVGRFEPGVEFGHPENDPVELVFVFAAPEGSQHVDLLAHLARALSRGMAHELISARNNTAMLQLLQKELDEST